MSSSNECFPTVSPIEYKGPQSKDPFSFKHYNKDELIMGKPMKEWLRFSVCFWHTFVGGGGQDPFGAKTLCRPWEDGLTGEGADPIILAKKRIDAAFEFFTKLGVEYYTFHDYDVAPEGDSITASQSNLDQVVDYLEQKQSETNVKLLWATQNLFTNPKYMNGGMTNPNLTIYCHAASQIQKVMDINFRLGGLNHVFWGGREGYQSVLNTDVRKECDHAAAMYHMAVEYKKRKGYTAQFLIEPKPREPTKHQYDYDAQTSMAFLGFYGLTEHFKLNIEPNHTTLAGHDFEHDVLFSSVYGMLGSIDSNSGDPLLGWDTDQFCMDVAKTTAIMKIIIEQGGLGTGGLNFDCKVRRESTDPEDLFLGHIGAMDAYALGLRRAAEMIEDGVLQGMVDKRYQSWESELGQKVEKGEATLEECSDYAKEQGNEPPLESAKQELFEMVRNGYLYK